MLGLSRDRDLPARSNQVGVSQPRAIRLHGVVRCLEQLGVAHRVPERGLGDLGQGVAGLDDVLLGRAIALRRGDLVRHLEHRARENEVGLIQHPSVEIEDLAEPGTVPEQAVGDLPETVAAPDRVVDGRLLRRYLGCRDGRRFGQDGRSLDDRSEARAFEDGRSSSVGGRRRERRHQRRRCDEEQCCDSDELTNRTLGSAETGQCGRP